jgi:hypothetical protein
MKRLVRSVLDPSPKTVSVKSLALLVGGLLSGVGISVHEYLQSGRPVARPSTFVPAEPGTCRRESGRGTCTVPATLGEPRATSSSSSSTPDSQPSSTKRAAASVQSTAPAQWTPDEGSTSELREESSAESPLGRSGRVSSQ